MGCSSSINTNYDPYDDGSEAYEQRMKGRRWSGIIQRKYKDNDSNNNNNIDIKMNDGQSDKESSNETNAKENNRYYSGFNNIEVTNEEEFTLGNERNKDKKKTARNNNDSVMITSQSKQSKDRNNEKSVTFTPHSPRGVKPHHEYYKSQDQQSVSRDKDNRSIKSNQKTSKHSSRTNISKIKVKPPPVKMKPSPLVDLSPLLNDNKKDIIISEFERHRNYLTTEEENNVIPLPKPTKPNIIQYSNYIQLHEKKILSLCVFNPPVENMYYATSSEDNTIRMWTDTFIEYSCIKTPKALSRCIAQFNKKYLLSAENIYIMVYRLTHDNKVKYILRDHTDIVNTIFIVSSETMITAGDDSIMRMWKVDEEKVIRYYEGHNGNVSNLISINDKRNLLSYGSDNKLIIWELNNANAINIIEVYYTISSAIGTSNGFITGSYDNKIRMYSMTSSNGDINLVYDTDYYGVNGFIMGECDSLNLLFSNGINEIVSLDLYNNKVIASYKGLTSDIVTISRDSAWINGIKNDFSKKVNRNIIAVCEDGFVYMWIYEPPIIAQLSQQKSKKIFSRVNSMSSKYK